MTKKILLIISFFISRNAIAQNIINGDFEVINDKQMPIHWQFFNNENFNFVLDTTNIYSNKHSLKISSKNLSRISLENSGIAANIYNSTSDKEVRHVTLNCKIKFNNYKDSAIDLFIENIATEKILRTFISNTQTNQWHSVSIKFDIDNSQSWYSFYYGIELSKDINAWIDDIHLQVNGEEIKDADCVNYNTTAKDIEWLNNHALPLDSATIEKRFSKKSDNNFWNNTKIVGIGEPTHGTHEAFLFKTDLIKYLIEHQGFTTIAMEESIAVCNILNDIINSDLNIKDTLMRLPGYKCWKTQEILSLLEWIRNYNKTHSRKIKFIGIDSEDWKLNLSRNLLRDYGKKYNSEIFIQSKKIDVALDSLLSLNQQNINADNHYVTQLYNSIDSMQSVITRNKSFIDNKEEYFRLLSYTTVCKQWLISRFISNSNFFRDSCMASNVENYMAMHPNEKIVLWAHNAHISNATFSSKEKAMGAYLKEKFKNNYMPLCFTTADGFYTAAEDETQQIWKTYPIQRPYQGTLENILQKANSSFYFLSLKNELPFWLKIPVMQLDKGYIHDSEDDHKFLGNNNPINQLFDGLIFYKKTTASQSFLVKQQSHY